MISGSTGPILPFLPYSRYLIVDYRFDPPFSNGPRDVDMTTNFRVKIGKIGLLTFIHSHIRNGL